jgi:hypothetical protein
LATLALVGTWAAGYGAASAIAPAAGEERAAALPAGARGHRPRLADASDDPFLSFLNGLFGIAPSGKPRRPRRLDGPRRAPQPTARETAPQEAVPAVPPASAPADMPEPVATYRTMCVRLCDGYYWPISFATTKDNFERDEQTCVNSCSGTAALYAYPNPGGQVDDMVNLQGDPYKGLATAFIYRTIYDPNCKCHPHPWEAAAIARYKAYADESKARAVAQQTRPSTSDQNRRPARAPAGAR